MDIEIDDYIRGYDAGRAAGASIAVGRTFLGAVPYADQYAGRERRESKAWRGALQGYMDGLPAAAARGIVCDGNGVIVRIGNEAAPAYMTRELEG